MATVRLGDEDPPNPDEAFWFERDDQSVVTEVKLRKGEKKRPSQSARMSAVKLRGESPRESHEGVGGQGCKPAIEVQGPLTKSRALGVAGAFIVSRRRRVEMDVVQHDSIRLLVILTSAEFAHQFVRVGLLIAEAPKGMPAVFTFLGRLTNNDGTDLMLTVSLSSDGGRGLGNGDAFGRGVSIWTWLEQLGP